MSTVNFSGNWNYRVLVSALGVYQIAEVCYDKAGEPCGWRECVLRNEDFKELQMTPLRMLEGMSLPPLSVVDGKLREVTP